MRFLIVDDDVLVVRTLARVAQSIGVDAIAVTSASAGLEEIEKADFDAVICDERLDRGSSGAVLLEHAREVAPRALRVLVSGADMSEFARAAFEVGTIDRFISKPYTLNELIGIQQLVRQRSTRPWKPGTDDPMGE